MELIMANNIGKPKNPETDLPPKETPTEPGKEIPWQEPIEEPTNPDQDDPWSPPEDPENLLGPSKPTSLFLSFMD
jgi:hypothetical protein